MNRPKVYTKYDGEALELYWVNPWSNKEEKIGYFFWPEHPVESTEQVEKWFEDIGASNKEFDELKELHRRCCDLVMPGEVDSSDAYLQILRDTQRERDTQKHLHEQYWQSALEFKIQRDQYKASCVKFLAALERIKLPAQDVELEFQTDEEEAEVWFNLNRKRKEIASEAITSDPNGQDLLNAIRGAMVALSGIIDYRSAHGKDCRCTKNCNPAVALETLIKAMRGI